MDPVTAALLATMVTALISSGPAYLTWANSRETKKIAQGNGKGNLGEMSELILDKVEAIDLRLDDHEERHRQEARRWK